MIYLIYLLVAASIILLSKKASQYVDLIEKNTGLSGAFVGGILLSAVTSLPELFTSISSTLFLGKPGLCMGNILGSNLFNMSMLGVLILIFAKHFGNARISGSHAYVTLCVVFIYFILVLNLLKIWSFELFTVNVTSISIFVLYGFSIKNLSMENGLDAPVKQDSAVHGNAKGNVLSMRQIIMRFILAGGFIIFFSIWITYITDEIAVKLDLGAGMAGAIFLGIATSLPEVSSSITLFRMKSYNIAIGNIIGSNIFNFLILGIADAVYLGGGIYDFTDHKTFNLLVFGAMAAVLLLALLRIKKSSVRLICSLGMAACYGLFLII